MANDSQQNSSQSSQQASQKKSQQASQKSSQQASRKLASERHKARHFAMQALYQNHYNHTSAIDIETQFRVDFNMKGTDLDYFRELITGVQRNKTELDELFEPHMNQRQGEECDAVTRALLRIGVYELKYRIDVPYKVAINEAVNLAKKFGPEDSHKFVNGVLDKVSQALRAIEFNANQNT